MLTESVVVGISRDGNNKSPSNPTLRDAGVLLYQIHPDAALRQVLKKCNTAIHGLAVSKFHIFAVQADKAAVHVYNRDNGGLEATVFFPDKITSIAIQDEETGSFVVLGMANGCLIIWETTSGRVITTNRYHTQPVLVVRMHKSSNLIVTGSDDTSCQVWDLLQLVSFSNHNDAKSKNPLRGFTQHRSAIADVIFNHGQHFSVAAISAGKDGTCYLWDPNTGNTMRTILLGSSPRCLALDPADRRLYTGFEDGTVGAVELMTLGQTQSSATAGMKGKSVEDRVDLFDRAYGNATTITCISVSYDSTALLTGHSDGRIVSWDCGTKTSKKILATIGQPITNILSLSPDGIRRSVGSGIATPIIVKPNRVELVPNGSANGSTGIPSKYSIQGRLTKKEMLQGSGSRLSMPGREYETRLRHPGFFTSGPFEQSILDEGLDELQSIMLHAKTATEFKGSTTTASMGTATNGNSNNVYAEESEDDDVELVEMPTTADPSTVASHPAGYVSAAYTRQLETQLIVARNDITTANVAIDSLRQKLADNVARRVARADRRVEEETAIFDKWAEDVKKGGDPNLAMKEFSQTYQNWVNKQEAESDHEESDRGDS